MTQTKKYRRRVSDDRVRDVACRAGVTEERTRKVLEAAAEVVHVTRNTKKYVSFIPEGMEYGATIDADVFHAEWEEIPSV